MSESNKLAKPLPQPLPVKLEDWHRISERDINDYVEDIHRELLVDNEKSERYRAFLYATYDEQAVEGSLAADNLKAAEMIREHAPKNNPLKREKLATLSKCLGTVLRRYHASRKERRQTVSGELVPDLSNNPE